MNTESLQRLYTKIREDHARFPDAPPVVPLDDFFTGNTDEECIAPNQWGDGRPPLEEFYRRFAEIQRRPNVSAVLVGIHGDWEYNQKHENLWVPAENIHIYTDATAEEVTEWISGLASDGAGEGWPYGEHPSAPPLPAGHKVMTVFWD